MADNVQFSPVLNLIDAKCVLPAELAPAHVLRRATDTELGRIRDFLPKPDGVLRQGPPYEFDILIERHGETSRSIRWRPLPPEEWRYYVIARLDESGVIMHDLCMAACLSSVELHFGVTFAHNGGRSHSGTGVFAYIHEIGTWREEYSVLAEKDVEEIRHIYKHVEQIGARFPDVKRAIAMFLDLQILPITSQFGPLGLFAVIELLVTHRPKSAETGDSLTHQIRTKIPLLARRFREPLPYD